MWKAINTLFPFADFLYILQLEEYDTWRYLTWLPRFFTRREIQQRQRLVLTPRAIVVMLVSVALCVLVLTVFVVFPILLIIQIALIALVLACIPLFVAVANAATQPLFVVTHSRMRAKAASILASRRAHMRVVMIAGSYGKTTTKGFIEQLGKHQFMVQVPPGNINTPSGIASWIIRNLSDTTTLLILEADGYNSTEYEQTVCMVPPDIAVITNVGDQHLERFGSRSKLAEALATVFTRAQPDAHLVTTAKVAEELRQSWDFGDRTLHPVFLAQALKYRGTTVDAPHLSASQQEDLALALLVADILGIPERFVVDAGTSMRVPERRQHQGELFGYDAIDDSYNISVSTAGASITAAKELAHKEHKKLLVITAGIPELGHEISEGNTHLGALLAREADQTVVLGSMFAPEIIRGLTRAAEVHGVSSPVLDTSCPQSSGSYTVLPSLKEFQTIASTEWNPKDWFLLLLPELNDLYY